MGSFSPPAPVSRKGKNQSNDRAVAELWLRLSAFLSMRSPGTQETYLGIVKEFSLFLGAEAGSAKAAALLLSAKDIHAIAYKNWLERQPGERPRMEIRAASTKALGRHRPGAKKTGLESTLSNATIAKKFAALRRIYRMFIASGLGVAKNPFDSDLVPPPPKDSGRKRPTEMVDFSAVMKVVDAPDISTPKGVRDKAILATLFGGGLRRSEVSALRIGDVMSTPSGTVYLYLRSTKAKTDARQALPEWAAKVIKRLLEDRRKQGASSSDYLFISFTGQAGKTPTTDPVSDSGIYKLFKYYCMISGAGKFLTPHSARATAITKLLSDGIPHREVQEFSRHSSIQMVELYDKRRMGVDENPAKKLKF